MAGLDSINLGAIPRDDEGKINPVFIFGAFVAAGLGLYFLVKKNSGVTGTVAGATSVNAALGSIQEEILNAQGAITQSEQLTRDQQATYANQVYGAVSAYGSQNYQQTVAQGEQTYNTLQQVYLQDQQILSGTAGHQQAAATGTF